MLASTKLRDVVRGLGQIETSDPTITRSLEKLRGDLDILISMAEVVQKNISIIIHIKPGETKISLIPRDVREHIRKTIKMQSGEHTTLVGYGISSTGTERFLERECGIKGEIITRKKTGTLVCQKQMNLE